MWICSSNSSALNLNFSNLCSDVINKLSAHLIKSKNDSKNIGSQSNSSLIFKRNQSIGFWSKRWYLLYWFLAFAILWLYRWRRFELIQIFNQWWTYLNWVFFFRLICVCVCVCVFVYLNQPSNKSSHARNARGWDFFPS